MDENYWRGYGVRKEGGFYFIYFLAKGAVVLPFWESRGWITFYFTLPLQYGQISCVPWFRDMPYVENNSPVSGLSGLYYSIHNKC